MTSCSGWMVATMSRIGPTRGRSISCSRISEWSSSAAVRREELLVLVGGHLAVLEAEAASQLDAHRLGLAGAVERQADPGPPVDHHRVADLVGHVPAADVEALAARVGVRVVVVEPAEEQRHRGVVRELPSSARRSRTRGTSGSPSRRRPTSRGPTCGRACGAAAEREAARWSRSATRSGSDGESGTVVGGVGAGTRRPRRWWWEPADATPGGRAPSSELAASRRCTRFSLWTAADGTSKVDASGGGARMRLAAAVVGRLRQWWPD